MNAVMNLLSNGGLYDDVLDIIQRYMTLPHGEEDYTDLRNLVNVEQVQPWLWMQHLKGPMDQETRHRALWMSNYFYTSTYSIFGSTLLQSVREWIEECTKQTESVWFCKWLSAQKWWLEKGTRDIFILLASIEYTIVVFVYE